MIELSYYDNKNNLRYLHGKPLPILGKMTHIVLSSGIESTTTRFSVSVDGVDVISFLVVRSDPSSESMVLAGSPNGQDSATGCFGSVLFYTSVVSPVMDMTVRSVLPANTTEIVSLFDEPQRLRVVVSASATSLSLVTSSFIRSLQTRSSLFEMEVHASDEYPSLNHPSNVLRVGSSSQPSSSQSSSSQSSSSQSSSSSSSSSQPTSTPSTKKPQRNVYTIDPFTQSSRHDPPLEAVHSVKDYEAYLQSTPYDELTDGTYTFAVPSDLEAAWRELNDQRAEKVRDAMKHFWKAYRRFAFGYDELQPLSQMGRNNWGGVALTLIDNLDTLWLMNLREEFEEAVEYVAEKVHFDSDKSISVFEFTIRILGGLLSAYHLSNDDRLLPRAIEAGNVVLSAFDGTHVLPHVVTQAERHVDTHQSENA